MKLILVVAALLSLFVVINAQSSVPIVLCTYYDNACASISECSIENTNACQNMIGGSMFVSLNANNTGIVSTYTAAGCTGPATNVSFTANVCANVTGGTSINVLTNGAQIWTTTTVYSSTPGSCSGTAVGYSSYTFNFTGYMCIPTNCTTGAYSGSRTTCGFTAPSTCSIATGGYVFSAGYNAPGCPQSSIVNYACSTLGCNPSPPGSNASTLVGCSNGVPSGTGYIGPGCVGNTTNPVPSNSTLLGTCIATGIAVPYVSNGCTSGPSPSTTGTTSATTGSTSTSAASNVSFYAITMLSVLSMIALSLLI